MPGESPLSMMQAAPRRAPRPAAMRRRRWPILVPAAIVVLAAAWSALWYYSAAVADRTLAGWVEREAAAGRIYSCGTQSIGGYPFSIRAHCADAAAEIKNLQPPWIARASAVGFFAEVYRPTRLVGYVAGPLNLSAVGQPPSLTANWTQARLVVTGVPPDPESVSVELEAAHLERPGANGGAIGKLDRGDLQARLIGGSARDNPVIEMTVSLAGASAAAFHPLLGQPMSAELDAVVRGFKDLSPKPWAERFREMQSTGGSIEIKTLRLTQANATVVGAGTLTVNVHGKLDGVLPVAIAGLEHIVPLIGLDRMIGQGLDQLTGRSGGLDSLIPGLSNALRDNVNANVADNLKKMGEPTTIDKQPAVVLPLRFVDSAIYLGMFRLGEMPPLF